MIDTLSRETTLSKLVLLPSAKRASFFSLVDLFFRMIYSKTNRKSHKDNVLSVSNPFKLQYIWAQLFKTNDVVS